MASLSANLPPVIQDSPLTFSVLTILVLFLAYQVLSQSVRYSSNLARFLVTTDENSKNGKFSAVFPSVATAIRENYSKFRDAPFLLTGDKPEVWHDLVVIPPKWVEVLKNAPDDEISFLDATEAHFNQSLTHTSFDDISLHNAFIKSVSIDLTRHLSKIMADMDDELKHAFTNVFPACDDWTEIYLGQIMPQIVALASGRIFVGLPLCRNAEFIKSTITFTVDSFMAGEALNKYPQWLRPWIAPWKKQVKECYQQHVTMRRLLKEQLDERIAMAKEGTELPSDMMTWIIKNSPEGRKFDLAYQAHCQLGVSLAAIHTTTMTASHAVLDLAARPEYIQPLRDEWDTVLATESDGVISKASMPKLKKLDSFLKETQRLSPLGPTTFERLVKKDFKLPDGTILRKGSVISCPAQAIAMDASKWADPEKFDGFRFEKLRQEPGNESKHQFAATSLDSMFFGHGRHACPGRFFAANEIKLILAFILRNYDLKFPEGQGRPENIRQPSGNIPDYSKPVLLKKRQK